MPVSDLEKQKAIEAYRSTGSYKEAAKMLGITPDACRGRVLRAASNPEPKTQPPPTATEQVTVENDGDNLLVTSQGQISTLEGLLEAAKVNLSEWAVEKWVANKWDGLGKNGVPVPLWQVKVWLERKVEWLIKPVTPVQHLKRNAAYHEGSVEQALIIPDSQNGYHVDMKTRHLEPLHDRKAWDLAVQMAQEIQPKYIVLLGDMLDLAPWSFKYPRPPSLRYTTQPSLVELHWWLGQLRVASPHSEIVYLEGNHEHRISKALVDNMDEVVDLRPVTDPEGHPLVSVPRLLGLDSLDIKYVAPYQEEYWLWDRVRIHHGHVVRANGGATVAAIVKDASHSEVVGHVHRTELACKTIFGPSGVPTPIFAMTPGTLTRIDGVVPATHLRSDWQQGLGLLSLDFMDKELAITPTILPIHNGRLVWNGHVYQGDSRVEDIEEDTSWEFTR